METASRFFKKYFLSTAAILGLFLILNVVLIFGVLLTASKNSTDPQIPIHYIGEHIIMKPTGIVTSDDTVKQILHEKKAWAMMLNDHGKVIWQEALPEKLPREYTASQIARFSRWYLEDYPVFVQEHSAGLLVIGCEPNSIVKYSFTVDPHYISTTLTGIILVVSINLLLMLILFWNNTRKIEKAVIPILHGIDTMAQGYPISLTEKGELAEINAELNRAGSQMIKKDLARAEWINGISHDIRTPLSIMLGYAGEIEDDGHLSDTVRSQAGIIRKQGEKLRRLIVDLNLTSKLEYSMQPLNKEKIYPVELVRQVISDFLNNGTDEKYDFNLQAKADAMSLMIEGDNALLTRMLNNLIQNCISHNPDGCKICIGVQKSNHGCMLSVIDDGIGINEEKLAQLNTVGFSDEIYKVNGEAIHGFGLRLVYQIVQAHKGNISFENIKPHGLKVEIHIPILK